jgi:hypothetical protein
MTNIIGPHGTGINETTIRPTDTASGSPVDTWFQPCINGDPNTGTKIPAVWLNKVTALLRRAIRGMSVAENELDDDMLLKAIRQTMPLLVNGTLPFASMAASHHTDGPWSVGNLFSRTQNVEVNVNALTTNPLLRSGVAQVTVTAMAAIDDAQVQVVNARMKCDVSNAGRTVTVAGEEMDAFASTPDPNDFQETGGASFGTYTFLVPLSNGVGQFSMSVTTTIDQGAVIGWWVEMHAYIDAIFPRA